VEVQKWWEYYKDRLPNINDSERRDIEYITGCSPLLLRALLGQNGKEFKDIEHDFLNSKDSESVPTQVEGFARSKKTELDSLSWEWQV